MLTYYTTYLTLLSSAWVGRNSRVVRELLYWVLLIALTLFVGFRDEVGCDWIAYEGHYSIGTDAAFLQSLNFNDPGHWLLISLLNYWGLPYQSLNVVTSGLFFTGLHFLAKRQPDPLAFLVLCFPILIINMPMSAIRQSTAIGFICLAFVAFIDRRQFLFVFWVLFGMLFHSSIIVFLMLLPFVRMRFNLQNIVFGLILFIPALIGMLQTESAEWANSAYMQEGSSEAAGALFRLGILVLSGSYFLLKLAPYWRRQFPSDFKLAMVGSWMMLAFILLFFVSSVIGDRFGYYLIPIQAMIFARIPYLNLGKNRQIHVVSPYVLLTLVFVVWTSTSWHFSYCYTPYQFGFG